MIVGVILLRTEYQFNGWRGQAKGRKRAGARGAVPRLRGRRGRRPWKMSWVLPGCWMSSNLTI
jgi:hypothetical protein